MIPHYESENQTTSEALESQREQLVAEFESVSESLREQKEKLRNMKMNAAAFGRFVPPAVYRDVSAKCVQLATRHQRLQTRLAAIKKRLKVARRDEHNHVSKTLSECFEWSAQDLLEPQIYNAIMREATSRFSAISEVNLERGSMSAIAPASTGGAFRLRKTEKP